MARATPRHSLTTQPRIGVLATADSRSRHPQSGTPYYMCQALERHCGTVVHLGPYVPFRAQWGRVRNGLARLIGGKRSPYEHTAEMARTYGLEFGRRLRDTPACDVLFAPFGSTILAGLETDLPIIYASDSTFALMCGYHPGFSGLTEKYRDGGNRIEQRALDVATVVTYPSDWAAGSAVSRYGTARSKIAVIPYGANLDTDAGEARSSNPRRTGPRSLLFLATSWFGKGGPIAFDAVRQLRSEGLDVELTVCGCRPPAGVTASWMRVLPRLDKNEPSQQAALIQLLLDATLLVLPTRNDCFGIVFAEASACGTPSVATDTGGVSAAVRPGENGVLLPVQAQGAEFAAVIGGLLRDDTRYSALSKSSRALYERELNWGRWGLSMREVIARAIA